MSRPVDKECIISFPYGAKYPPELAHLTLDGLHHGIDFACPIGTIIYLPKESMYVESGIKQSTPESYYGYYTILKFWGQNGLGKSNYRMIFMHLSRLFDERLKPGDWLKENAIIGLSGETGSAQGHPHLHFEIQQLIGGKWAYIDPVSFINV